MTAEGGDPRAIGPRIRMRMPDLSPREARAVEMVLSSPDFGDATSLREVADAAGLSEAAIVKIAQKLGFTGFRDFRSAVAGYNRLPIADLHREVAPTDGAGEILAKMFRTTIQALEETLAIVDVAVFERIVDRLHGAGTRDFYGVGGSAQIARDIAHKFLRIGLRANVFDDAHMMLMSAALLGPGDVAVVFSHSGRSQAVLEAARIARAGGAGVVAVTNFPSSPLTELANEVLLSTARGSPVIGENAAARIVQLNLLDAVFAAVAQRDYAAAERNLARTMEAVTPRRRS